ncbi:MAG: DUF2274 domain-containing protein [Afipia sp.]|jgi:hypothetical protein|nr:DUF2274 domain-containing protein [Afipia sp.]WIG53634.1 MAG: uncharacterized protein OJF48_004554 [Afipia sp.]
MSRLKLGTIEDDKPVKLTIEMPAPVHRNLVAYAEAIGRESGQPAPDPSKIVVPMIERFMATDRAFGKVRKEGQRRSKFIP